MGNIEAHWPQAKPLVPPPPPVPSLVPEKRSWKLPFALRVLGWVGTFAPAPVSRIALDLFLRPRRKPVAETDATLLKSADEKPCIPFASTFPKNTLLQCYVWGTAKRTALLVHGWESHAGRMGAFVAPLVAAGFRVVAFDGPAHGKSGGVSTDMPDFASAIQTIITHFGSVDTIIGHSFGAASTLWYLAQKNNKAIKRVVLLGTPSGARFMLQVFANRLNLPQAVRQGLAVAVKKRYGQDLSFFDLAPRIAGITSPVLFIHDRQDNLVDFAEGESLSAALPGSELYPTEGLWHSGTIKDPTVIEKSIAFIHGANGSL